MLNHEDMKLAKPVYIWSLLILTAIAAVTCQNNMLGVNGDAEQEEGMEITSANPASGKFGTVVTISGREFGETPGENLVTFNGLPAEIVNASATSLEVIVPKGARNGPIEVTSNGKTQKGPDFDYILTVNVSTYAGSGELGYLDGEVSTALFNYPVGLELKANGELIVVDYWNHSIRLVSPDGVVSTLAGDGTEGTSDGIGSAARFYRPIDAAVASDGAIFVSDFGNHRIRHISPSGSVSTFAGSTSGYRDGPPNEARFRFPAGLALADNDTLYVSDSENNFIRWIAPSGDVGTYVGSGNFGFINGYASQAQFRWPFGLDSDSKQRLFIADHTNHSIRMVSSEKFVSTFTGDGEAGFMEGRRSDARFNAPYDVETDRNHYVYVADHFNHRIRMITPSGTSTTLAGDGTAGFTNGDETQARFNRPIGLAVNQEGTVLFVADHHNHAIRRITME